jgi:hypothetical protein
MGCGMVRGRREFEGSEGDLGRGPEVFEGWAGHRVGHDHATQPEDFLRQFSTVNSSHQFDLVELFTLRRGRLLRP